MTGAAVATALPVISEAVSREATLYTSAQALANVGLKGQKYQADAIVDICIAAQRNGAQDLSLREIARRWELLYGRQIDVGTVSARVSNLIDANRLVRLEGTTRSCTISGKTVHPVSVPVTQVRLCA